jgi:hypothetical protein
MASAMTIQNRSRDFMRRHYQMPGTVREVI